MEGWYETMNARSALMAGVVILLAALPAAAQSGATAADGPAYSVRAFRPTYVRSLPLPRDVNLAADLGSVPLALGRTVDGAYVAPRADVDAVTVTIDELNAADGIIAHESALIEMSEILGQALADMLDLACKVTPHPADLPPTGRKEMRLLASLEGPDYEVSAFDVAYVESHPELPSVDEILENARVNLSAVDGGFRAWSASGLGRYRVADLVGGSPVRLSAGAVQLVMEAMTQYLIDEGHMAVSVLLPPDEISRGADFLADLRGGRTTMRLLIATGRVAAVRTLAQGDRIPVDDRIDHPLHARIRDRSPFGPGADQRTLLDRKALDDYVYFRSRHPGRRVDAAIASYDAIGDPLGVSLDYLVTENPPLTIYGQASNTGTEETERWRYRFGLFATQLTNNDDIFSLEYVTADFDETNAVIASYEAPFGSLERLRWRVYGNWSEYSASEVGRPDELFTGESWGVGAEVAWNFFQDRNLFIDAVGGVRYSDIQVDNNVVLVFGDEEFFIPYIGLRLQQFSEEAYTDIGAFLEWNVSSVTAVDSSRLSTLGRLFPEDDWTVLRWDVNHAFFLEPLLNRAAWEDITTPESSTLAHEVALRFRGQYSFDDRLIPQEQMVAGGAYSVRGYPESVVVGDTVLIGSVEYRLHFPRAFGYRDPNESETFMGRPFRVVPQQPYGHADWDLIGRVFFDIGRTMNADRFSFEQNHTLYGAGVGVELVFKRNVNLRLDWGFALDGIDGEVNSGSNRVHFVATILY